MLSSQSCHQIINTVYYYCVFLLSSQPCHQIINTAYFYYFLVFTVLSSNNNKHRLVLLSFFVFCIVLSSNKLPLVLRCYLVFCFYFYFPHSPVIIYGKLSIAIVFSCESVRIVVFVTVLSSRYKHRPELLCYLLVKMSVYFRLIVTVLLSNEENHPLLLSYISSVFYCCRTKSAVFVFITCSRLKFSWVYLPNAVALILK